VQSSKAQAAQLWRCVRTSTARITDSGARPLPVIPNNAFAGVSAGLAEEPPAAVCSGSSRSWRQRGGRNHQRRVRRPADHCTESAGRRDDGPSGDAADGAATTLARRGSASEITPPVRDPRDTSSMLCLACAAMLQFAGIAHSSRGDLLMLQRVGRTYRCFTLDSRISPQHPPVSIARRCGRPAALFMS